MSCWRCTPTRRCGMLADATDREHEILGAIPYQANEAVLHTDTRLLPRRRRAWASWNYHLLPEPSGMTTVTYHMNRLQALRADREFCVTLNRTEAIDPSQILRTDRVRPSRVHRGGRAGAGARARDQRRGANALLRRLLGIWLPRGRRRQRAAGGRRRSGSGRERRLRGDDPPPPLRGARARVRHRIALAYFDLAAPPRGRAARALPALRLPRPRRGGARAAWARLDGPVHAARRAALVRALLQPDRPLLLLRRRGRRCGTSSPR